MLAASSKMLPRFRVVGEGSIVASPMLNGGSCTSALRMGEVMMRNSVLSPFSFRKLSVIQDCRSFTHCVRDSIADADESDDCGANVRYSCVSSA